MALLQRVFGRKTEQRNMLDNPSTPLNNSAAWQYLVGGGHGSASGEIIDTRSALMDASVFTVVRVISESLASLPLQLLRTSDNGRTPAKDHPVYSLMANRPNPEMKPYDLISSLALSLALSGNSYVQVVMKNGKPSELWPLLPTQCEPMRDDSGALVYKVNVGKDGQQPDYKYLPKEQVLHTRLFSFTGLKGFSPIEMQKNLIGLSIAQVKNAAILFSNANIPALVLKNKSPLPMEPEGKTKAREDWSALQSGSNTHRIAVLDSDFDIEKLGFTAEESQWLESQQLSIERIASLWRVPAHLVGSTAKVTNSNMVEQNAMFVSECLRAYMVNICQELAFKLLTPAEQLQFEFEFCTEDLLLGTYADKAEYFTAAINGGWMSPAECRADLGLPKAGPELAAFRVPINIGNANLLLKAPEAPESDDVDNDASAIPDSNMRAALRNYGASYLPLFRNAIRSVIEGGNVTQAFGPVLESIAASVTVDVASVVPILGKFEKRAKDWKLEGVDIDKKAIEAMKTALQALIFAAKEAQAKTLLQEIAI
jgi:HK97 family phage portal protein